MNRISHWIDGSVVEGTSGRSGTVFNPATGEQAASVDFANEAEVDAAVASAQRALPGWRSTSLGRRAEVMFHMRELVDANRKEIASLVTAEHGKVLSDALGELARGLEKKHHMNMDHSAWEGFEVDGKVDTVLSRGTVILQGDQFLGRKGHGRYLKRGLSQYLV